MTVQEARKQINDAEEKIEREFSSMRSSAYGMIQATENESKASSTAKTAIPLIACLIGLILCFAGAPGFGSILLIGGAIVTYNVYMKATNGDYRITQLAKQLNDLLNQYPKI